MFFYNVYNWRRGRMSDFVAEQQRDGNEKTYLLPRIAEEGENEGCELYSCRFDVRIYLLRNVDKKALELRLEERLTTYGSVVCTILSFVICNIYAFMSQ